MPDLMQDLTEPSTAGGGTPDLQALCTQGLALIRQQRYRDAAAVLERARTMAPHHAEISNALGLCARELGQFQAALALCRRATALDPASPGAWSNFGMLYRDVRLPELAVACFERAVALDPHGRGHRYNLGTGHVAAGRHDRAIACFTEALGAGPDPQADDARAVYARALCHLARGDLQAGWRDYEARFAAGIVRQRALPGRRWALQRYHGQRLVVAFEQGMGDAIWAARTLPAVKALGGELVLECPPALIRLLASMGVVDRFVPCGEALPDADWHCHLCSLPGLMTAGLNDIRAAPYLSPGPAAGAAAVGVLQAVPGDVLKVGIVWSGNTRFKRNVHRATSLSRFVDAFMLPGVRLFSLQKDEPAAERAHYPGVVDLAPLLGDFGDTAAAVAHLDLVIMTDSAVAHLCGAMGRPVWVLLGYDPAWFWLTGRSDCPWYGSLRLFRQRGPGDWNSVFDAAGAALLQADRRPR